LAGVTTILTLPGPSNDQENQKEVKKDKIPALIAVVYVCVRTRLSGRKTCQHVPHAALALSTLAKLREDEEGVEWEGWEKVGMKDVAAWLSEILAIVKGAGLRVKDGNGQLEEDVESRDKVLSKATKGGHEASNAQQSKLNSCLVRFPTHPNPSS
jgi:hypothetical protein